MQFPPKLSETGFGAKDKQIINKWFEYVKSITPRDTPTVVHDRTATGTFPRSKAVPATTGGDGYWR